MATAPNQQLAERRESPLAAFRQTLQQPAFREQLKMALPNHIPADRFERVALTAVQTNPDLLNGQKVDRHSLFGALIRAAQDGLLPDGREGAIVPYKGKAQWMPMTAGIMKKVRNSGEIASWDAFPVFEKDKFQRLLGDDMRLYHEPFEDGDPGQVVGAYSIVTFKDGTKSKDYLPRWKIEKARKAGSANSPMWSQYYEEGAVKTVIKHHSKRLPMSTDLEGFLERAAPEREETTPALAVVAEESTPVSRLDALEQHIEGETIDASDDATEPKSLHERMQEAAADTPDDAFAGEE